jgi:hypothetical protein
VILNIVCTGNLYEAVWQLHEGSYERLTGANGRRLRSMLASGRAGLPVSRERTEEQQGYWLKDRI